MKLSDIHEGHDYLLRVTHRALGGGTWRTARRVTVISANRSEVIVEWLAPTCVNRDNIAPGGFAWAMLHGELRYELRPRRCTVRPADILRPAPPTTVAAEVVDAVQGDKLAHGVA